MGNVNYFLGIQINRDKRGNFLLGQENKMFNILQKCGFKNSTTIATPMDTSYSKIQEEINLLPNNDKHRSVVGPLLYLSTTRQPDIAI